jgi:hypothetical protein
VGKESLKSLKEEILTSTKKFVWLFCACVIFSGCNRAPKVNTAAEVKAILETCDQWIVAIQTKDVEKITTFYADDAVLIYPDSPIVEGLQNIKEVVRATYTDPTYLWETYSSTIDKVEKTPKKWRGWTTWSSSPGSLPIFPTRDKSP